MTITRTAINLLARTEGVHPAHMANRLALAIRVAEAAAVIAPNVRAESVLRVAVVNRTGHVRARLAEVAAPASGTLSDATLALALQIVEAN